MAHLSFIVVFPNTFYNKYVCEKMSIQYTVQGFELTTFGTSRPINRPGFPPYEKFFNRIKLKYLRYSIRLLTY